MKYATAAISITTPYRARARRQAFSPIQPVTKGTSDSQKSRCRFAHSTPPFTVLRGLEQVVVVVPVDAEVDKTQHVAEQTGTSGSRAAAGAMRRPSAPAP